MSRDPLLESLVYLSAHHGRGRSASAIRAGLAYDAKGMGPGLFCQAAERMGLKAALLQKPAIAAIADTVLPVVLLLKEARALVLLRRRGDILDVYDPAKGRVREMDKNDHAAYGGYALYVSPRPEFLNPETPDPQDMRRHWFWSVVRENRRLYGMVLIAAVLINLFALAGPLFIKNVYDRVIPNESIETGWALGIGALTVFVFDFILRNLRGYLIDIAGRRIDVLAGARIFDHLMDMRMAHRPRSSGAFANMLRDFDSVREFFTSATITGLVDLPFALFFIFIIYHLGGALAMILLGLTAIVMIAGALIHLHLKGVVRGAVRTAETKHGLLVESINGLETIKAVGADGHFRARYAAQMALNARYGQASRFWSGMGVNLASFAQQSASVLMVLAGMYLVRDGDMTVGSLIAAVILAGRALAPIGQVANLMARYHQAGSALRTLEAVMQSPVERPVGRVFLSRPHLKGAIAFENISFSYPGVARPVLQNVSFRIQAGERVGIIGRVGSGKSTIARLMMGLYEADEGVILLDETDTRQIDPADMRRAMAYIAQDVTLFTGSVRDNIAIGSPRASEEEILAAAQASGVHDFVARHPMGYDAPVGERGEGLSGGQRQAVALARALLSGPQIFVCDEPTNALDMQAEEAFKRTIREQTQGKTLVLITHRNSTLDLLDRLILIDQGRVVMDGPREKILAALAAGQVQVQAGPA